MVSVVIPFYAEVGWLREALESVFKQTYSDYEVIVINDGSKEDLTEFKNEYLNRIVYIETKNSGPAHARNIGIEKAKGEYIAFLDSDDLWLPEKLEKQVAFMEHNNVVWSHTNYQKFVDGFDADTEDICLNKFSGNIFIQSLLVTHIATPCVMIKTSYIRNKVYLRFQEKMRFGQDYYLWLRLSKELPLLLVDEVLTKVRVRGTNAAIRARAHVQVRAQIYELLISDNEFMSFENKYKKAIKGIYWLCFMELKIIRWSEKYIKSTFKIEFISKILYIFPYTSFKLLNRVIKKV